MHEIVHVDRGNNALALDGSTLDRRVKFHGEDCESASKIDHKLWYQVYLSGSNRRRRKTMIALFLVISDTSPEFRTDRQTAPNCGIVERGACQNLRNQRRLPRLLSFALRERAASSIEILMQITVRMKHKQPRNSQRLDFNCLPRSEFRRCVQRP